MKRLVPLSLCLLFGLAFAVPAYSQCNNEKNQWEAIDKETDAKKRAEKLENFIKSCAKSANRPDADKKLVNLWLTSNEHKKIMAHADAFQQSLPTADAAAKSTIYSQAMLSAVATPDLLPKVREFGELALGADPNNFTVLSFLAFAGILDGPKTLQYAEKATTLPKPAAMTDAQYQTWMGRMEGLLGLNMLSQSKWREALPHFEKALKLNPKDHANQYRYAVANMNVMVAAVQAAQTASDAYDRARIATPPVQADVDKARAKAEAESQTAITYRDAALDSFARAFAIGGQFAGEAKARIDALYSNKNKSLEGVDAFIAAKKAEVGL